MKKTHKFNTRRREEFIVEVDIGGPHPDGERIVELVYEKGAKTASMICDMSDMDMGAAQMRELATALHFMAEEMDPGGSKRGG